jgi:predicted nuclease of predicted toxin-antitoxin system
VNGLFIRLYLDEDISVVLRQLLTSRGYDAQTTGEAGRLGTSDADQLAFATEHGRAVFTHNHGDFENLATAYIATSRHHAGIIIASRRKPNEMAARLLMILDSVTAEEMRDQLLYI